MAGDKTEEVLKIAKFIVSLACLGLFVWWGLTVPLGERTLFGHILAIGQSEESQELVRGTRAKVSDLTKRLADGEPAKKENPVGAGHAAGSQVAPAPPQDDLAEDDRKGLRRLIADSAKPSSESADRSKPSASPEEAPAETPRARSRGRAKPLR